MTSQIINAHQKADEFIQDVIERAAALGVDVVVPVQPHLDKKVDYSANRYEQRSAYFELRYQINDRKFVNSVRVSDHMSQWATAGIQVSAEDIKTPADRIIQRIKTIISE